MALGRPPKADSGYRVSTHKIGKYIYASTQPVIVDQDGNKTYKHKHWGRLDGNRFVPGTEFILLSREVIHYQIIRTNNFFVIYYT